MGVKGLLSYITDDDNDVFQTVELSQLARKIYYETKKTPKLLCDFMSLVSHFLHPPVIKLTSCGHYPWYAQVSGADFHLVADRACKFVAALKHLDVEPVFFIDGARGTDQSFEGKVHVLKDCEAQKLQETFRLQQVCEHTAENIGIYIPCNAFLQIEMSLKKAGAEIVYCNGEADPEIFHYAQSHDEVCGILSNDSDFAIANGCVMFPIDTFDVNNSLGLLEDVLVKEKPGEIVCQVIYPSHLANSLGIRENQLPDLAVLCGTDYTHHLNKRLSVLTRLGVTGGGVESIAEWLKDKKMPLLQYQPMRKLCNDNPELTIAIEQSYKNYTLEVPQSIDNPPAAVSFASPLYHIIEEEARSGENNMLLPVAKKGILWCTMVIENLTLGQPCLSSLLLPLRKVMYALLGVQEVREYGRSQMQAYDEVVVPVCAKPEDVGLGIQCFYSLRELEQSGRLIAMFTLMNKSLNVQSISNVKKVVNGVVHGSQKLPDLPGCRLVQSAMLCSCLKFIACLNKVSQPPLGLTDSELDAILITCLICATDGEIMPHIVNVMPSMRTFTVSEWFALILMHCYRIASLVGVISCPEPKQMFYQMAFVPYHFSLESHVNLTTEQQVEIKYVHNAIKTVLTLPVVERFRASIFNPNELQPLALLLTLFDAALNAVVENREKLLPCVLSMDDKYQANTEPCSESEETDSEIEMEIALDEVRKNAEKLLPQKVKAKQKSLSNMSFPARQRALKSCIWGKKELPIMEHRQMILNLISNHQVVCIEGETGCGKSSKLPQFILEACLGNCKILAGQPNLLTARKLAERVSEERGEPLDTTVGYCDAQGNLKMQTILTFGTTGYMLKALLKSSSNCSYTHIILDEIHERSTEIDFALLITRKLAVKIPHLKIILISATLQGNLFTKYFRRELGHDKVADPYFVGIKRFPVKVVFIDQLDQLVSARKDEEQHAAMNQLQILAKKLENNAAQLLPHAPEVTPFTEEVCMNLIISQPSPGDTILIFHSGFGDINEFCNNLHKMLLSLRVRDRYRLFIFHSQVQSEDQDEAFLEPLEGTANIIVASRGSETSLTIPNLRLVINFGINKEMMYNSAKRISELSRQWCSRASCIQREGRVGRVSEGVAVHLFTKEFYETLPDFGPPEIIRVPLAKTVLRAKEIGPKLDIPLPSCLLSMVIEPPSFVQFSTALHDLAEYGAIAHSPQQKISEESDVTLLGKFSLSLPLDLNLCRLVLLGILFGCPLDGIVIAATTAMYQDVFSRPMKVLMNDLHQFCHSLTTSTFSRIRYDNGYYSNPIMIRNMFIDWLKYKNTHPHTSRRELAIRFQKAIRLEHLLHLEDFVGDIARCVANCIPHDTALHSELQTLSHIRMENKGKPVFGEFPSHRLMKLWKGNRGLLHFCNNCVRLKALIAAAAPDDILCGERACESSDPYSRTFAQKCMEVIKNECFSLSHTLCMDMSKLDEEQMWKTDKEVFEKLFKIFPSDFQLSAESKVVKDIAVLHFQPNPSLVLTKTAQSCTPKRRKSSTADISKIPPEVNFFWRFGEQMTLWEIDQVDALFPVPSHPCALVWYRFDESKSPVDTVTLNFRNPTGFICQYDKPSQPYFAVATGAFASPGGSILAPRLTVLPNMPTSLMMVLAFQLPTSAIEFLINKKNKTVKAIKINSVEIPCTDIENYISSDEIVAINQLRKAISNAMTLPMNDGCIPLRNPAITRIPGLLHDLLNSCKPNISKSTTSNLQTLSMDDRLEGLVWEMVTPGKSIEGHSTSYYGEFRCSLVGTKPYAVKEVSHDQEPPHFTSSIEYTQSVSAKLLAESKKIHKQGRVGALDDLSTVSESLKVYKKVKRVEADLKENDKQRAKRRSKRKKRKKANKEAQFFFSFPGSPSSMVIRGVKAEDKERGRRMGKRRMKGKMRTGKKTTSISPTSYLSEEDNIKEKIFRIREKKEKRKAEKKFIRMQKERMTETEDPPLFFSLPPVSLCSSVSSLLPLSPKLPFWPVGDQVFLHDQECMVLSKNCPKIKQKQDPDAKIATTSKQKHQTQSDNAGLENSDGPQTRSLSQIVPGNGNGKQTVSKSLTTAMLFGEKTKPYLTTAKSNPAVHNERKKSDSVTETKSEKANLMQDNIYRETQNRKSCDKEKKTDNKGIGPINSEWESPAQSDSSILSVTQFLPANGENKAAIKSINILEDETPTGNPNFSNESKLTCTEAHIKDENSSTKSMATIASRCQSEVQVLKVSHIKEPFKEMAVSDMYSTKHKAASEMASNTAQHSTGEHMGVCLAGFISDCGGQTRPATLIKEAPLKEKVKMQEEKETVLTKKKRVEIEMKQATFKRNEKVTTKEEDLMEEDIKREKQKKRKRRKVKQKKVTPAATISEQQPPVHSGIAQPKLSLGTQLSEHQEKKSLVIGTRNTSVPDESKETCPTTQISENGRFTTVTVSANRYQSEVDGLKVMHAKKPLQKTAIPDGPGTKHKTASEVAPHKIPAQPGTDEHMAQFLVDFINECGGETRLGALRRVAFRQYQGKYYGQYTFLSKGFLRQYDCFEIFDDSSGVCHVRVVGDERRSLANTEPEKMEHKTKKCLSYKPVCDIKMKYSSKDTCVLEGDFAFFPGSPEHIVEYLHNYLSTHFFPYGCPVSSLNALYQKEYIPKCSHPVVSTINADFLKEFSSYFVLQSVHTFVKLKEGVDHSDTSQLKGCPYTPQHVNNYFRRYLAKEGAVSIQQLRVLFSECYMKEFKMPQKPIIHFIREDFFKRSGHLFVTFADIVVFRK